jgi:two-component system response regulator FixJ
VTSSPVPVICVIDDDRFVRDSLVLLLSCSGYHVVGFEDAESFLEADALADANLLIVDVRLPGMNGVKLIEQLEQAGTIRPVIVITGHADDSELQKSRPANLLAFLHKPVDPPQLLEVIERLLSGGPQSRT